jgi:hypothetical protein
MSKKDNEAIVTQEHEAGAHSLDGEELTSHLMRENRRLLEKTLHLERVNSDLFTAGCVLVLGLIATAVLWVFGII